MQLFLSCLDVLQLGHWVASTLLHRSGHVHGLTFSNIIGRCHPAQESFSQAIKRVNRWGIHSMISKTLETFTLADMSVFHNQALGQPFGTTAKAQMAKNISCVP